MALFKRTDPTLFAGLEEALGRRPEVLAHGTGDDAVLAGTREALALRRAGEWSVWPWERVGGGSWKAETGLFRWKDIEGNKFEASLMEEGRLPALFRERIEASTVVQVVLDAPTRGEVQIVARRGLGKEASLEWYAVPSGGADLDDPATRAAVVAETDRLIREYFDRA